MNKQDLNTPMGAATEAANSPADDALNSIIIGINSRLKNGDSSTISVYGTLSVEQPAFNELTNTKTGASIQIYSSMPSS